MILFSRDTLYRYRVALCALLVTIISYVTYVVGYDKPQALFWDENYHIASAQHYLNRDFFMETHPPLGKLLIALGEYTLRPNGQFDQFKDTDHGKGDALPPGFSFAGYRLVPTLLAWLTAPLLFLTAWLISGRVTIALLPAALYTFDNALIVHSRAAMLEGTQLFFVVASLLSFFALSKGALQERYRPLVATFLGASLGAAVGTKVNALVCALIVPFLLTLPTTLRSRLALMFNAVVTAGLVYTAIWYVHFSIATHRNTNLKENGYYTSDASLHPLIDRLGQLGALEFFTLMKGSAVDYLSHYSSGVPALDLCKTGENGSPVFLWPFGARTIQYRWEAASNNTAKYLYLVPNPVGWAIGLSSLILAVALLLGSVFGPQGARLKSVTPVLLFVALYAAYMVAMGNITRVLYLYHYFIPLIFTFLLTAVMWRGVDRVGTIIVTDSGKAGLVALSITLTFVSYLWYSPFTYYKPIGDRELASRSLLSIWDLRCSGCPRTNLLASGGAPTIYTPRFSVSGVKPTTVKQSWGQPRLGFSVTGKSITAANVAYPSCFGMHSNAILSYPVQGRFLRLTGRAGLPDYVAARKASVTFVVEGDGKTLWESPIVRGGDPALSVDVSIAGVNTLTLKIQDAGDGISHDHGFWSDLRFEEAPATR
jgi:hypothetical protein